MSSEEELLKEQLIKNCDPWVWSEIIHPKEFNQLEEEIVANEASAMFGVPGKEEYRMGSGFNSLPRTLGIGWILYGFVRAMRPKVIVEIGAGGSTACLLWGLRHNGLGYLHTCDVFLSDSLDPYGKEDGNGNVLNSNHAAVARMIEKWGMENICTVHHESSFDFIPRWKDPIDIVVIDGDHSVKGIENDIKLLSFLTPGGYAFFHDFTACTYEVGVAVRDWVARSDEWSLIVEPNCLSMAIIQRKFSLSPKHMFSATALAQVSNKNNIKTPFQLTDPKAAGAVIPWNGEWFPKTGVEFLKYQAEGNALAQKILEQETRTGKVVQRFEEIDG
jgi:hypothetical protein